MAASASRARHCFAVRGRRRRLGLLVSIPPRGARASSRLRIYLLTFSFPTRLLKTAEVRAAWSSGRLPHTRTTGRPSKLLRARRRPSPSRQQSWGMTVRRRRRRESSSRSPISWRGRPRRRGGRPARDRRPEAFAAAWSSAPHPLKVRPSRSGCPDVIASINRRFPHPGSGRLPFDARRPPTTNSRHRRRARAPAATIGASESVRGLRAGPPRAGASTSRPPPRGALSRSCWCSSLPSRSL